MKLIEVRFSHKLCSGVNQWVPNWNKEGRKWGETHVTLGSLPCQLPGSECALLLEKPSQCNCSWRSRRPPSDVQMRTIAWPGQLFCCPSPSATIARSSSERAFWIMVKCPKLWWKGATSYQNAFQYKELGFLFVSIWVKMTAFMRHKGKPGSTYSLENWTMERTKLDDLAQRTSSREPRAHRSRLKALAWRIFEGKAVLRNIQRDENRSPQVINADGALSVTISN